MIMKLPAAWLQLRYQKIRLLVALSGVTFAVVLIFMQFGFREALLNSAVRFHESLQGDLFLLSPRSTSLASMESFPERRLYQSLALKEVDFVTPIYLGFGQWKNPANNNYWRKIFVIAFDIKHQIINLPGVQQNIDRLKISDFVLFDEGSRTEFGPIATQFRQQKGLTTEIGNGGKNHKVQVVGLFKLGTSFSSDGNLITSHLNFFQIFSNHNPGLIHLGLIKLKTESNAQHLSNQLQEYLPKDVKVLSKQELIEFEKYYWQSSTAVGFVFRLGVAMGIIVEIVVVYQILYTNIADHLAEYATLKAIGYRHRYLLSIVLQQAAFIAILGYIPGFIIACLGYDSAKKATLLPLNMTYELALSILGLTIIMCLVSGTIAIEKLKAADPADIF